MELQGAYQEDMHFQAQDENYASDCESCTSDEPQTVDVFDNAGLIILDEDKPASKIIKEQFLKFFGKLSMLMTVVSIHTQDLINSPIVKAKLDSFQMFERALVNLRGGTAKRKLGWYGGSKEDLARIMAQGFGFKEISGGRGVCLVRNPALSLQNCVTDVHGVKHMLLCRFLVGSAEYVDPTSTQQNPSSDKFDSGVDNVNSPKKFIVWSSKMNTHILPEYVVSFRDQAPTVPVQLPPKKSTMPFSLLIKAISKNLPEGRTELITGYYKEYKANKISRNELLQRFRQDTANYQNLIRETITAFCKSNENRR